MEISFSQISFSLFDNTQKILQKVSLKEKIHPFFMHVKEIDYQAKKITIETIFDYFDLIDFDVPLTYSFAFFFFLENYFLGLMMNNILILFIDYFLSRGKKFQQLVNIVQTINPNLIIANENSFQSLSRDLEKLLDNKLINIEIENRDITNLLDSFSDLIPDVENIMNELALTKVDMSIFLLTNGDLANIECSKNIVFIEHFQRGIFGIYKNLNFFDTAWTRQKYKVKQNNILQFIYFYEKYNYFNTVDSTENKDKYINCFLTNDKVLHVTFPADIIYEREEILQSLIKELQKQFYIEQYYFLISNYDFVTRFNDKNYNAMYYADMLFNDPLFKKIIFLNERTNTLHNLSKKISYTFRHLTKLQEGQKFIKYNFVQEKTKDQNFVIKTSFKNLDQEGNFSFYLAICYVTLSQFELEYMNIQNFYRLYFPEIKHEKKLNHETKISKKSREKISELQKIYPKIFSKAYTSGCQQFRQPRHFYTHEKDKMLQLVGGNEHRILNYPEGSDDWYVCINEDRHNFIGLTKIIKHEKNFMYPYYPCCFPVDQYNKESSPLNKYYLKNKSVEEIVKDANYNREIKTFHVDYVSLTISVVRKTNALANLPFFIEYIFKGGGMKYFHRGNQTISEFLVLSPILEFYDSFFYWIEYIRNPQFKFFSDDKKLDLIVELRKECAQFGNYNFARQEMYMFTDDEIRKKLLKFKTYIDPKLFYSFFKKILDIDLILVEVSDLNSSGGVIYPNTNGFYIPSFFDIPENISVMIIYFNQERHIYYCFLLIRIRRLANYQIDMSTDFPTSEKPIKSLLNFYNIMDKIYVIKDRQYKRIKYIE